MMFNLILRFTQSFYPFEPGNFPIASTKLTVDSYPKQKIRNNVMNMKDSELGDVTFSLTYVYSKLKVGLGVP